MFVAEGVLRFERKERQSDRYGAVQLYAGRIPHRLPKQIRVQSKAEADAVMAEMIARGRPREVTFVARSVPVDHPIAQEDPWPYPAHIPWPRDLPFGQRGRLLAEIVATYEIKEFGDLHRRIDAVPGVIGETIVLGTGWLFLEQSYEPHGLGLVPDDRRQRTDWLDPYALWRVFHQRVRLHFQRARGRRA